MAEESPQISVLMPVYNAARYVDAAVESILAQSFGSFEFVIINDGSTDATPALLAALAQRDQRIRLVNRENRGLVASLNEALHLARADIIARMDADDLAAPQRLALQHAAMNARPLLALGTQVLYIDADGDPLRLSHLPLEHDEIDRVHLSGAGSVIIHPAACLRRRDVLDVGGYRAECEGAEDLDLFLRLAERGPLANLPDVLLHYRLHLQSFGYAQRAKQRDAIIRGVQSACQRRGCPVPEIPPAANAAVADPARVYETWAWWALRDGHVPTARRYAWRALKTAPFRLTAWRALACAWRGR